MRAHGRLRPLRPAFRGPLHLPGEAAYDAHRATWSGSIDPRPAVVAEASTPSDVRAAVLIAQEHGLPFAVQATGHGTHVPSDGGLLLKTSQMAEVLVDPDRRIARVGPGALWGDVIAAAAPCGLAPVTGSSPTVGVTGFTLGGGVGWLSRKLGFAADNLLRVDIVTADGRLVRASANEHADLFWAVRGGGGNFGVVTALEFRLHPVSRVYAGTATFPIARAAETLARYRDWAASQPDELTTALVLTKDTLAVRAAYVGEADAAERALRPLWQAAGPPATSDLRPMGYAETAGARRHAAAPVRAVRGPARRRHRRRRRRGDARGRRRTRSRCGTGAARWRGRGRRRPGRPPRRPVLDHRRRPRGGRRAARPARDRRLVPELPPGPGADAHRLHRGGLPAAARGQASARPRQRLRPQPQHPPGTREQENHGGEGPVERRHEDRVRSVG